MKMNIIDELRNKYATHEYMKQKLEDYIIQLPMLMSAMEEEYTRKQLKKHELEKKRDEFSSEFITSYSFFYIPQTEMYVEYVENYVPVTEDYIVHLIGTKLPKTLITSKHKIITTILKKIRENLFIQTTNSYTSKIIVPLLPFSKEQSKYFLTILGDFILNKRDNLVCYVDSSYKPFLKNLNQSLYLMLNKSFDIFKHKYYDHKYELCRVITGRYTECDSPPILNMIVAAVTLSTKYGNSDGLVQSLDQELIQKINILKTNTPETLIQLFLSYSLVKDTQSSIVYRDVYFLWKTFLRSKSLPFVVSQQNFKNTLTQLGILEGDSCDQWNTTEQTQLLKVKHFWDKYIVHDDEQSYDIQELVDIYNKQDKSTITVETMKEVLLVEYPTMIIEKNTILYIKCLLWNKQIDIEHSMALFKHSESYSTDKMYEFYCQYTKNHHTRTVSQEYFEKMIIHD